MPTADPWFSWIPVLKMNLTSLQDKQSAGHIVDKRVFAKHYQLPSKALTLKLWKGKKEGEKWPWQSSFFD